jgi:hypothetical protein
VKISTNWSLVPTCEIAMSPLMAWSLKVVSDVYVFGPRMITRIVSNLYGTLIVTEERDMVQRVTIVLYS